MRPLARNLVSALLLGACLLLVAGGAWAGELRARAMDERLRQALLRDVVSIAQAVEPDVARALTFTRADQGTPADERLRGQLAAYAELLDWGGIYTMALRGGELVFGPESFAPDDPMASAPGTVYREPSEQDFEMIRRGQAYVAGPVSDEYGTFVSALAPVLDPRTGEALFAIGIDVLANDWQSRVNRARMAPMLWAATGVMLCILAHYAFAWRNRLAEERRLRWRYLEVVLVVAWGLLITALATALVAEDELRERDHVFEMLASAQTASLRAEIDQLRDDLHMVALFFCGSEVVEEREFAAFTQPMVRSQSTRAYGWIPILTQAEADLLLAEAPPDAPQALPLWERGPDGVRRPASGRDRYYPLTYLEPEASKRELLGYDLGSQPALRAALAHAAEAGLQTVAGLTPLSQADSQWRYWLLEYVNPAPSGRRATPQVGYVVTVAPLQEAFDAALRRHRAESDLIATDLVLLDDPGGYALLASHPLPGGQTWVDADELYAQDHQRGVHTAPIFAFGRAMALRYQPTAAFYALQPLRMTPTVAVAGTVLTACVAAFVGTMRRQSHTLERLVAERTASLAESEAQYRALYDEALNPILVADADGRYVDANAAALAFLECTREELIGRSVWDFAPPEDEERQRAAHSPFLEPRTVETPYLVGGRVKTLLLNVIPLRRGGRTVLYGIGQDITERQEAEARRLAMERQLLEAQKLESLGLLAGGIAHDFNNLLGAILGNIELATLDLPASSAALGSLQEAVRAAHRASDLTRQMLAYAGKGRFVKSDLDLSALVQENVQMLRAALPRDVQLRLNLTEGLPLVHADAGQMQQIVMNLIINAAEALDHGPGVVTLATGQEHYAEDALLRSRTTDKPAPGPYVWLEVSDNGCGMSAETMQRMFDPFFTTKPTGRGLGMSAVLGIVNSHGGAIWVDSALGQGTTIRVALPALAAESAAAPVAAAQAERTPLTGVVLVVDDEEVIRNLTCALLQRMGLTTIPAANGEEACAIYAARRQEIDGVLLDMIMPGMDGAATIEALHRINPGVRALLCSGYGDQAAAQRLTRAGLVGFLLKPFDSQTLRAAVEQLLHRAP